MSTTNQQGGGNLRHALAHPADPRQPEDPDSIYVRACVAESDRASIVAFLAAEAKRRDKEARSRIMSPDTQDQLRDEAVLCSTLELAIERGDDLRSGECITIDDIPAADLVSIDAIGCVVGDMFTGFKQSIEAPSKTGIAIALHLGGWRVGMSVEEAHAIIARSGILLYEVTPIARATGGGE